MEKTYEIHFAPLQGYTDWIYRNTFNRFFGGINAFYTPFLRVEKENTIRNKDIRDIDPANNTVPILIPQILPGDLGEFRFLTRFVAERGYKKIDINMGCPFPMITGRKKGAGILPYPEKVKEVLDTVNEFPEIEFSLKMRLGMEDTSECIDLLNIINNLRLCHVSVHARFGKQQYKGEPDLSAFENFYQECRHPLFYNGDLKTAEDIENILLKFPLLRGVLIGRGLLSSPFVAEDFAKNETFSSSERKKRLFSFHQELYAAYSDHLQGENQLLLKMKTLWEYFLPATDRKSLKQIKKANKLRDYHEAVNLIFK